MASTNVANSFRQTTNESQGRNSRPEKPHPGEPNRFDGSFAPTADQLLAFANADVATRRIQAEALDGILVRHVVDQVRSAGADVAISAARELNAQLRSRAGKAIAEIDPELAGMWLGYSRVLGEAGRRRDLGALNAILAMFNGRAGQVFKALQNASTESVERRTLLEAADGDEAVLSKALRALESAGLVAREKIGRSITVRLGAAGSQLAELEAQSTLVSIKQKAVYTVLSASNVETVVSSLNRPATVWGR
jgi:DNA-binding transcriptional ArsR family regulator